ncbi:MAG: hypothetical protein SPL30_06110 [Succinivibrio sp.]|nr:hypothetical protein [Succinivibrio sp.]
MKSAEELKERICKYFSEINKDPAVCHWRLGLVDIDISGDQNTARCLKIIFG